MINNSLLKHSKEIIYYSISVMFERASFYGLRILLIIYLTSDILKMEQTDAFALYGFLAGSILISRVIGAIFGDLLLGNRNSIFIGGILQAIGTFCLCIPSLTGVYTGLSILVIGNGFYNSNLISNFGKTYLNNIKQLDAGFTIYHLAINLGAFWGIVLLGYISELYGYFQGFILSAIIMILSLFSLLAIKGKSIPLKRKKDTSINNGILKTVIGILFIGLFWSIYEISSVQILPLTMQFREISALGISKLMWQSFGSILTFPISIVLIILWTLKFSSTFSKLLLGFVFGIISYALLFFIPEIPVQQQAIFFLISLFFLAISETYIAPVTHSLITQYCNPKYFAILFSLAFIPTRLFSVGFGLLNNNLYSDPRFATLVSLIGMSVITIGLTIFLFWNKTNIVKRTQNGI